MGYYEDRNTKLCIKESTEARRMRLGSKTAHGQQLCSAGYAHARYAHTLTQVTCERCLIRYKANTNKLWRLLCL